MTNEFIDNIILRYVMMPNLKVNNRKLNYILSNFNNIKQYLQNRVPFYESYVEIIHRIQHNETTQRYCPICGKPLKYFRKHKWAAHCSVICASKDKNVHDKFVNTNRQRHGVNYPAQLPTNIFKTNNPQKNKEIHERSVQTCFQRYGVLYAFQSQKAKDNMILKYGVDNIFKLPEKQKEIRDNIEKKYGDRNYNNRPKSKETCLDKYGVDNYAKTDEFKERVDWDKRNHKSNITKEINGTFDKSNPEDKSYILLKTIFGEENILRNKKHKLYPFKCDFYIKTLNMYIECQYHWTHGFHPFNENDEKDLNKLHKWEIKQDIHPFYKTAIKVWTKKDPHKRLIAKQNNLNYVEFWNYKELYNYFTLMCASPRD